MESYIICPMCGEHISLLKANGTCSKCGQPLSFSSEHLYKTIMHKVESIDILKYMNERCVNYEIAKKIIRGRLKSTINILKKRIQDISRRNSNKPFLQNMIELNTMLVEKLRTLEISQEQSPLAVLLGRFKHLYVIYKEFKKNSKDTTQIKTEATSVLKEINDICLLYLNIKALLPGKSDDLWLWDDEHILTNILNPSGFLVS
ncbi:MAG: hypothetical protein GF364_07200 [Candidatus Lokiarchaeota archaeon]|nr:hypothetical protein [Candidatus Lokiarchaeota archaeon]